MPSEEQMKDHAQQQQGQEQGQQGQQQGQQQQGQAGSKPGEPSPGIKDKEAETSNSYGNTRDSGEEPK